MAKKFGILNYKRLLKELKKGIKIESSLLKSAIKKGKKK